MARIPGRVSPVKELPLQPSRVWEQDLGFRLGDQVWRSTTRFFPFLANTGGMRCVADRRVPTTKPGGGKRLTLSAFSRDPLGPWLTNGIAACYPNRGLNFQLLTCTMDYFVFGFEAANGSRRGIYQVFKSLYKGMKEIDHEHVHLIFAESDFTFDEKDISYKNLKYSKSRKSLLRKIIGTLLRNFASLVDAVFPSCLDLLVTQLIVNSPWACRISKSLQQEVHLSHWGLYHSRIASSIAIGLDLPINSPEKSWLVCLCPTMASRSRNYRIATFVHDLIPLDFSAHDESRSVFLRKLNCSCQNSDIIICVSHTTAKRLIRYDSSVKNKLSVIYPSISEVQIHHSRELCPRYTLPISLCSIGTIEPRKNWPGILQALLNTDGLPPIQLIFIGGEASSDRNFHRKLRNLIDQLIINTPHSVIFTGRVSAEEKCKYLQQSAAFVYVPFMEGAALPIIEAQLIGCPTLISDLPVFREFIKTENTYFADPYKSTSIGAALQKLCTDLKNGQCRPPMDSHRLAPLASPFRFAKEVMAALAAADLKP